MPDHTEQLNRLEAKVTEMHTVVLGNGDPDRGLFARVVKLETIGAVAKWAIGLSVTAFLGVAGLLLTWLAMG